MGLSSCIFWNVSIPSMSGIIWSINIRSYSLSLISFRQSFPLVTASICAPVFFKRPLMTSRFISLSSTTSNLTPEASYCSRYCLGRFTVYWYQSSNFPTGCLSNTFCKTEIVKVEPLPYSLLISIVPCISLIIWFVIASPSPVPSMLRFLFSSSLTKDSNSLSWSSLRIPIPVSDTLIYRRNSSSDTFTCLTESVMPPFCVYLTAFVNRFVTACLILSSSPYSRFGVFFSTSSSSPSPLAVALAPIDCTRSFSTLRNS